MIMTSLQIDYVDYSDDSDYTNDHWKGWFTSEELSFLQLTHHVLQKGSVTEAGTEKVKLHSYQKRSFACKNSPTSTQYIPNDKA